MGKSVLGTRGLGA